jgi:hypothetical protein
MLYRLHNNIFIVGLLTLGFLSVMSNGRAFCLVTPVTFFAFITQVALLISISRDEDKIYSEKTLFFTVLIYSLFFGGLMFLVSNYYDVDLHIDDPDANLYYIQGMKSYEYGVIENAQRIINKYPFDDWGALLLSNFMLYLIPSCFFMNAIHVLTGAISAVLLYRIGNIFMPKCHAFMAGFAYSTSSYLILFHCTYLKESIFTFLVICAMYFFYKSIAEGRHVFLLAVLYFLIHIAFYRPAVDAFLIMSFVAYYAITQRRSAVSVFLYGIIIVGLVASMAFLQGQVDNYTAGGDDDAILAANGSGNYSGGFNYFVGWFSAFFGPFPSLFPTNPTRPAPMNFYGAGLTYKTFLVIPLWIGIWGAVKNFNVLLIPIVVFVGVEMAATGYIMASFELRKVMLHVPFTFILVFYGLYLLEKKNVSITIKHRMEYIGCIFTIGVLVLWNLIRVKG